MNILHKISPMKIILGGYCTVILLGTLLLALPFATKGAGSTGITDCFFTATSATCVTGLIRFDTFTHWTLFGQLVIMLLIQIGGVGFMTIAIMALVFAHKKISLSQRALMQNSVSAPHLGDIVHMTKFIAGGTLVVEGIGALLLSFAFVPQFGVAKGIYFSIFHSISAFCNGGFDLMGGTTGEFSSLTGYMSNWYVNIVIMLLIFVGGLGFFVWHDVGAKRGRFKRLNLQSKLVLTISSFLVVFGAVVLFILEFQSPATEGLSLSEKICAALFQSVSARTAGFNTIDLSVMSEAGKFVMISLMLIGGSTGSTAGGMKTTTVYVLCASISATFFHRKNIEAFGRRLEENIIRTATCVFMIYIIGVTGSAVLISAVEGIPMVTALFETASAMATVGLSFGVTPTVGMFSKLLLAFLMICGRVGSITMLLAFASNKNYTSSRLAMEKIQVG